MRKFIFETLDWTGWFFCELFHRRGLFWADRLGMWFYDRATDYGLKHGQLVRNSREGAQLVTIEEEAEFRRERIEANKPKIATADYSHKKRSHFYEQSEEDRTWLLEHKR